MIGCLWCRCISRRTRSNIVTERGALTPDTDASNVSLNALQVVGYSHESLGPRAGRVPDGGNGFKLEQGDSRQDGQIAPQAVTHPSLSFTSPAHPFPQELFTSAEHGKVDVVPFALGSTLTPSRSCLPTGGDSHDISRTRQGRIIEGGTGVKLEQGDIYMLPQHRHVAHHEGRAPLQNLARVESHSVAPSNLQASIMGRVSGLSNAALLPGDLLPSVPPGKPTLPEPTIPVERIGDKPRTFWEVICCQRRRRDAVTMPAARRQIRDTYELQLEMSD